MKDIPGYEGKYAITPNGRVWSFPKLGGTLKGKWVKVGVHKKGYLQFYIYKDSVKKTIFAHKLVAITFIPNPKNLKEINHINGIKTDNRIENLEWVTHKRNMRHAFDTKLQINPFGQDHNGSKLTNEQVLEIREKHRIGITNKEIAKHYPVCKDMIYRIVNRKNWIHI